MPKLKTFTVERQYLVPIFQHVTVEAATADQAAQLAMDHESWDSAKRDDEGCRDTYITGIWESDEAYSGESVPVAQQFGDWSQELAGRISADETAMILDALDIINPDTYAACALRDRLAAKIRGIIYMTPLNQETAHEG